MNRLIFLSSKKFNKKRLAEKMSQRRMTQADATPGGTTLTNPYTFSGRRVARTQSSGVSSKSSQSPSRLTYYKYIRNYEGSRVFPKSWYEVPPEIWQFIAVPVSDQIQFRGFVVPRVKLVFMLAHDNIVFPEGKDVAIHANEQHGVALAQNV